MILLNRVCVGLIAFLLFCVSVAKPQGPPGFTLQVGHSGSVGALAFSPGDNLLASGSSDNSIKIWDLEKNIILHSLKGRAGPTLSLDFSPDGALLVSSHYGGPLLLWDVGSGRLARRIGFPGISYSALFTPDGEKLIAVIEGLVHIWDVQSGALVRSLEEMEEVQSMDVSDDGEFLVAGNSSGEVILWDLGSRTVLRRIQGHAGEVKSISIAPGGEFLASGHGNGVTKIWDIGSGELLHATKATKRALPVTSSSFAGDGKMLVIAGGRKVKFVSLEDRLEGTLGEEESSLITSVSFSNNGKILAVGKYSGKISFWSDDLRLVKTFGGQEVRPRAAALSKDGTVLATAGKRIMIWDPDTGELKRSFGRRRGGIFDLDFSPDSRSLVASGADSSVGVWDHKSGEVLVSLDVKSIGNHFVGFLEDGEHILVGGRRGEVSLCNSNSGQRVREIFVGSNDAMSISPSGKILAVAKPNGKVHLWELEKKVQVGEVDIHGDRAVSLDFSPDGRLLAVGESDGAVVVWDVESRSLHRELLEDRRKGRDRDRWWPINTVAFVGDESLFSCARDGQVQLWDIKSGSLIGFVAGSATGAIDAVASSEKDFFVVVDLDGGLRYKNLKEELLAVSYSLGGGEFLTITPEGYFAASGGGREKAGWSSNGKFFTIGQYEQVFHKPSRVKRKLSGLEVENPDVAVGFDFPPSLTWVNSFQSTEQDRVEIYLEYEGTADLDSVEILFNGNPVEVRPRAWGMSEVIVVSLALSQRSNRLVAYASDVRDLESSLLSLEFEYLGGGLMDGAAISFEQASGLRVNSKQLQLNFKVYSSSELAGVDLNGESVAPRFEETARDGTVVLSYEHEVPLRLGSNHFVVTVVTREGVRSREILTVNRDELGKMWIVAIGISEYLSVSDLRFAHRDAIEIRNYYAERFGLRDESVFLLTDEGASLKNIKRLLGTELPRLVGSRDTVVIYFSGHGVPEQVSQGREGLVRYLMPYDGDLQDLYSTAFPMSEVAEVFRRLAAESVVFIADTCFSGAVGGRTVPNRDVTFKNLGSDSFLQDIVAEGSGRIVFAGSRPDQLARELLSLEHGVFTYYLLEGLRGQADNNRNSLVELGELFTYVSQRVEEETGNSQVPILKGEFDARLVLGRIN